MDVSIQAEAVGVGVPPPIFLKTTSRRSAIPIKGFVKTKSKGGAPKGNSNALKHGRYTGDMRARRREVTALIRRVRATIAFAQACAAYPALSPTLPRS